jgi:hypothetical protein
MCMSFGVNTGTHENTNGQRHYAVGKVGHPSNYQYEVDHGSCATSLIETDWLNRKGAE